MLRAGTVVPQLTVSAGRPFEFTLPAGTFVSAPGTTITVEARLANGEPLPSWLRFDPASGSFSGEPPPGWRESLNIMVIARDQAGHQAVTRVQVQFEAQREPQSAEPSGAPAAWIRDSEPRAGPAAPAGKASLAEQFARYGHQAWQRELDELTRLAASAPRRQIAMEETV